MASDSETDQSASEDPLLEQLTDDQKKLLLQALELVKQRVFSDATRRMRNYLIVAASLVTIFGAVSVVGLRAAIKDATVSALREDAALRQSIKEDAAVKVTRAEDILRNMENLLDQAKTVRLTAAQSTASELEDLLEEARRQKQEEILLFENSARELNDLVRELRRLREQAKTVK